MAVAVSAIAFFFGQGATNHVLKLLPGGTWLLNKTANSATHVNGSTGEKDGEWPIRLEPGQSLDQVVNIDGSLIAIDSQGNAHIVDAAVGPQGQTTTTLGSGYKLFVGDSTVYATQTLAGDVQPRLGISRGLGALGGVLNVGGPMSSGAVTDNDVLVTAVPEDGTVVTIDQMSTSADHAFTPNSNAKVAAVRGKAVLVDLTAGVASSLDGSSPRISFDPSATGPNTSVEGCDSCSSLVIGKEKSVVAIDLAAGGGSKEIALPLAGATHLVQAIVQGDHVFVRDSEGRALRVSVADSKVERVGGDATFTDITSIGGHVYLNNANGANAVAVDKNGQARDVVKYTPESTQQAKQQLDKTTPTPTPTPTPQPSQSPEKPDKAIPDTSQAPMPVPTKPGNGGSKPTPVPETSGPTEPTAQEPAPTPTPTPSAPGVSAAAGERGKIVVTVTWSDAQANGAVIDHFVVELGGDSKVLSGVTGSAQVTFTGLSDGTRYTAKVTAHTNQGIKVSATDAATTRDAPAPVRNPSSEVHKCGGTKWVCISLRGFAPNEAVTTVLYGDLGGWSEWDNKTGWVVTVDANGNYDGSIFNTAGTQYFGTDVNAYLVANGVRSPTVHL